MLLCVTDSWGRQVQFEYDAKSRIAKFYDPANLVYSYEYDGASGGCTTPDANNRACAANNLTRITYPDGKTKTYHYNEAAQINGGTACANTVQIGNGFGSLLNSLTGITDENGVRYASWTYDCQGLATSSQHAGGVEKVSLAYGTVDSSGKSINTITHYLGTPSNPQTTTRSYNYQLVLGVAKNAGIDQPCVECGPAKARTYDGNGNVTSSTDWNGIVTTYGYDLGRNLETSRVEASGTPQARTVMTSWYTTYRLPLSISEPLLRTTYTYDVSGNVLTKTEQATTDANGAAGFGATLTGSPRTWTYTYNNLGQVLTVTGPRTDVTDVTTYTYDGSGNLSTVTNALGHVTSLTNYDANGRVGHITEPNGATTDLAYSPRGWLTSRVVTSGNTVESTNYDYDGVGQIKLVTLPDRSSVSYVYDDAHRLTQVSDSLGNSIIYTLDLRGNRTQEQIKDPNGNLARQISRVYDNLNRLQQVTGAAQ
ncbi:RHS repeat protein [Undibacterium terreum]|uniref:RHS repeat protein n=1 Tax=Undibacterium terreum TaxID=1224302 RepID=UPI00166874D5|nr:RHS repeat protein [Undibacterium terreum]